MANVAPLMPRMEATELVGTVVEVDEELTVSLGVEEHRAVAAASCLLEPRAGDTVLVAQLADGRCYVTAVLERTAGAPTRLRLEGDTEVALSDGALSIDAPRGLRLTTRGALSLISGSLKAVADEGTLAFRRFGLVAQALEASAETMVFVAGAIETTAERVAEHARRAYRWIEDLEQIRAGRVDLRAERSVDLRGRDAFVTAERLVKMNGDQVHLG